MSRRMVGTFVLTLIAFAAVTASAQSFRVQCPASTITHPVVSATQDNNSEPRYTGATTTSLLPVDPLTGKGGFLTPTAHVNGAIKCQQVSGGDGYATMGDGTQT